MDPEAVPEEGSVLGSGAGVVKAWLFRAGSALWRRL